MNCRLKNAYIKIDDRKFNVLSNTNCEKIKKIPRFVLKTLKIMLEYIQGALHEKFCLPGYFYKG